MPTYKHNVDYYLFKNGALSEGHSKTPGGYGLAFKLYNSSFFGKNFLWCADIQHNINKYLYVDTVHYNSDLSSMLADCIIADERWGRFSGE